MLKSIVFAILLIYFQPSPTKAYNILVVLPYSGRSHFIAFQPFIKQLVNKGNNVTLISYYPIENSSKNFHEIRLSDTIPSFENWIPLHSPTRLLTLFGIISLVYKGVTDCDTLIANSHVQSLLKSSVKFDVVLVEQFHTDCPLGLAYKLSAPVVGITANSPMPQHYSRYGIPNGPSYTSFQVMGHGIKPNLFQRVEATLLTIFMDLFINHAGQYIEDYVLSKYFEDIPAINDLAKEIKFLLLYQDFIFTSRRLLPSNVIEVAGHHIVKPKPLPHDLKKFIEESKYGVIYISFGSMLQVSSIESDKLQAILDVLQELPQRVIWKWDNETVPFKLDKIYSSKWLPQNDILGHPKVLAFVSHCGQSGITEAVHYGVPIIGVPMFGDQISNAAAVAENGIGVKTSLEEITKKSLLNMFKTVLDPEFRNKAKTLSKIFRDKPISALDKAVFWTEFTAKYQNFTFKHPSIDIPFYKFYCIDIIIAVFIVIFFIFLILKMCFKIIILVRRIPLRYCS